ncbi:CopG family transcriptional regulator [Ammonicoccus fulvus]|uniref:CopG family transcriptional regulator n=1 Tax=Ammonicoccus fulvus TaxID=3138240 RepID=A0ABZ3FTZ6_9ACTN
MAMILRTTAEDDALLESLAQLHGISKHEAALRAIREVGGREAQSAMVARYAKETIAEYAELLQRLAQ